ncbi:hypothetical protein S40288_11093 [Stachybotrys chartarum IBT 40288]|nr:hypothetical protein S40288_11093 [Stachybotrys chartarum IBT 40288]
MESYLIGIIIIAACLFGMAVVYLLGKAVVRFYPARLADSSGVTGLHHLESGSIPQIQRPGSAPVYTTTFPTERDTIDTNPYMFRVGTNVPGIVSLAKQSTWSIGIQFHQIVIRDPLPSVPFNGYVLQCTHENDMDYIDKFLLSDQIVVVLLQDGLDPSEAIRTFAVSPPPLPGVAPPQMITRPQKDEEWKTNKIDWFSLKERMEWRRNGGRGLVYHGESNVRIKAS